MKDLTKGNIMKLLIGFAVPLLIGNIFQQLYNVVDTKVVGEILGKDALAALGASGPIYNMIVGALMGLGNGFGIVIAKFHGAKQMERMRQAVANAVYVLGVEVGLDSNGRKNRGGHLMEDLVENHIANAGFVKDVTYPRGNYAKMYRIYPHHYLVYDFYDCL